MIFTVVGATGSGKSLFQSYKVYNELTRMMNEGKKIRWYKSLIGAFFSSARYQKSYYDWVVLNSDFNDGRGNFTRFDYQSQMWQYGGKCIGISDLPECWNGSLKEGVLKNCLIHLDEGGTQFATTDWDKMPEGYKLFLTTHRHKVTDPVKKRFDIFIYTQHKDLIEVTFRRIANRIYLIRPLFGFAKDPTRPRRLNKLSAIKMWLYWRHELLEGSQKVRFSVDGKPIQGSDEEELEKLIPYTWLYLGKKYRTAYDTSAEVRDMKRMKSV